MWLKTGKRESTAQKHIHIKTIDLSTKVNPITYTKDKSNQTVTV